MVSLFVAMERIMEDPKRIFYACTKEESEPCIENSILILHMGKALKFVDPESSDTVIDTEISPQLFMTWTHDPIDSGNLLEVREYTLDLLYYDAAWDKGFEDLAVERLNMVSYYLRDGYTLDLSMLQLLKLKKGDVMMVVSTRNLVDHADLEVLAIEADEADEYAIVISTKLYGEEGDGETESHQ